MALASAFSVADHQSDPENTLFYLQEGVKRLLEQGEFDNGWAFKKTQAEALVAYDEYLNDDKFTIEERLKGFFEIPTGVGKTATFVNILAKAFEVAENDGVSLRAAVVVPTTVLLEQIRDEFNEISPGLAEKIGLYGDGNKDLSRPLTIMTYDAWVGLTKNGTIGPHNIDILISDEAHRGTSEDRVENVFSVYDGKCAMVAFTATARFDESKSVEQTHGRQIYYKSLAQAVHDKELAPSIETQAYLIRVEPPTEEELQEEFNKAATVSPEAQSKIQKRYRRRLRQKAWNKWAHRTLREGRTSNGDYLTDNQVGIYVDGTTQASELEALLNNDLELQARAREQGYEGVAIAIHTGVDPKTGRRMSRKEQRRRLQAYKDGKYIVVIGDEKFKEGFNHKPMKTVLDYQHGSLVDKAQILGRGARRWLNKQLDRLIGLTFIDTMIYIGSDNPEEDKKLEARAKKNAVMARVILEDSYVFEDGYQSPPPNPDAPPPGPAGEPHRIFIDDDNVTEFTTLDDLYTLAAEQEKLNEDLFAGYEPISEEDQQFFKEQQKRTKLKGKALFGILENPPQGMNQGHATSIISGATKSAIPSYVEFLKTGYLAQPNATKTLISEDDKKFFKDQNERTGLGGKALFSKLQNPPKGMESSHAKRIVSGELKSTFPSYITFLKKGYLAQPYAETTAKAEPISKEDKQFFEEHVKLTGLGGYALFNKLKNPPKGLKSSHARGIVSGELKSTFPSYITFLKKGYLAQLKVEKIKPIAKEDKQFFDEQAKRTGLSGYSLFCKLKNPPEGMKYYQADKIVSGRQQNAPPSWVVFLKEGYALQPTVEKKLKRESISETDKQFFKEQVKRTGLTGYQIYAKIRVPLNGMKQSDAKDIVSGRKKKAPPSWVTTLKKCYLDQNDGKFKKKLKREPISATDKQFFKEQVKRTGLGGKGLFNKLANPPEGMTWKIACKIASGKVESAVPAYVASLKKRYSALPDADPR